LANTRLVAELLKRYHSNFEERALADFIFQWLGVEHPWADNLSVEDIQTELDECLVYAV
jgi:hypothetical protein